MKYRRRCERPQSVFVPRGFWLFSVLLPRPQMDKAALRHLETAALAQGHHSAPSLTRFPLIHMDNQFLFSCIYEQAAPFYTHKRSA